MNLFFFGVYPYLAGTIFLLGSIFRYEREQDGWTSYSSQLLASKRYMLWASNLWHVGILLLFLGHFVGMLTPFWEWLGVGVLVHEWIAMVAGITFGIVAMIGGTLLLLRRYLNSRVRANTRFNDLVVLIWILITLLLGLGTEYITIPALLHGNTAIMSNLEAYVQSIATFRPDPAQLNAIPWIFKVHILFGMTVFLIFPFTRLVHIWTVPLNYLVRRYQIVRARRMA